MSKIESKSGYGECALCRVLDSASEERRISSVLLEVVQRTGVDLYRLPSPDGTRYAVDQPATSSFCAQLFEVCKKSGVAIEHAVKEIKNNAYEFDQVEYVSPVRAEFLQLYPKPHCHRGESYLKGRGLRLELIESRREALVIPSPGLGPRVIGKAAAENLKVTSPLSESIGDWPFPIDLVYTWVDTDDDIWRENFQRVAHELDQYSELTAATNAARWHSRDELRYSLRSVEMYAPFIRNIYIVTNGQRPKWLMDHNRVQVVSHEVLYPDVSVLPTFNSNHIETVLHHIPGLAEHFLYLNDDFFFARRCAPSDFFTIGGVGKVFYSSRHLDDRPVSQHDRASVAAHKNSRALLAEKFGVSCHRKFKHAPYVMRRSVWDQIERDFGEQLAATRRNRFRSRDDINGQFLYAHYAVLVGAAYPGNIKDRYVDVQDKTFAEALAKAESAGAKVFCINDANSDQDNVDLPDKIVRDFLERRFPVRAPWESIEAVGGLGEAAAPSIDDWRQEVRRLGPSKAEQRYIDQMSSGSSEGAKRLYRLYLNQGRHFEAAKVAEQAQWSRSEKLSKQINALSKELKAPDILPMVTQLPSKSRLKALNHIVRSIESFRDYEAFIKVAKECCQESAELFQVLGAAARRCGQPREGVRLLEKAFALTSIAAAPVADKRRESQRMAKPDEVLKDLLEVAGDDRRTLFLDAGTLLGCIRDGDFIDHDYDIDLATRNEVVFFRLANKIKEDWRFNVSRVRTPHLVIQARHINGTYLDVFLHIREGDFWVKKSHVYGWKFEDYALEPRRFAGVEINVPCPSERYLEQMYGPNWRTPISGFDSRLSAPNCFFPDRDELVCTLLNKAVTAARTGDREGVEKCQELLKRLAGYNLAWSAEAAGKWGRAAVGGGSVTSSVRGISRISGTPSVPINV